MKIEDEVIEPDTSKDPINDIGDQYDNYYGGGEKSIYAQQYKNQILPRDQWVLNQEAIKLAKHKFPVLFPSFWDSLCGNTSNGINVVLLNQPREIRILDYGCGDGRYLSAIEDIAGEMAKQGINIHYIGVDPSLVGLETYQKHLLNKSFCLSQGDGRSLHHLGEEENGYNGPTFKRGNLTVELVHNNVNDTVEHQKGLIGEVDMTMCMFGVLSHIPGRENRKETLKMFGDITNPEGSVILTLPGPQRFLNEQLTYDTLRQQERWDSVGLAKEPGDILYAKFQGQERKALNYYHIYTAKEVLEDLGMAGLMPQNGIQVNYISDIQGLTSNPVFAKLDEYISWLTPSEPAWVDRVGSYNLSISKPVKTEKGWVSNVASDSLSSPGKGSSASLR